MTPLELALLQADIRAAFLRINKETEDAPLARVRFTPAGSATDTRPLTILLEDALNLIQYKVLGLVAAALRDEVKR